MRRPGLRRYVRAHLHRQLFMWFGATIVAAVLTTFWVMHAVNYFSDPPWHQPVDGAQVFLGHRFASVWDDAEARRSLMQDLAQAMRMQVEVRDTHDTVVEHVGQCGSNAFVAPVQSGARQLGSVRVCNDRPPEFWRGIVPLSTAGIVLWACAGILARRLARPLQDITRVARDIGEGRLASRARLGRRPPGEVGILADAINDMAAKIEKQMADQLALLAVVSHELRTPLQRMRVLLELGREGTSPIPKVLDSMDEEIAAVDGLVGQLLASSRLDFAALNKQPLNGEDVLRRALERAGMGDDLLHIETPRDHAQFVGDATLMACALSNLLENARKHGRGVRAVRLQRREAQLVFVVEDAGPGFEGSQPRIFEAFYQGPQASARDPTSMGLGLNLVRRIAEAHQGQAFAHNVPDGGAAVGFSLTARPV